MVISKVLDTNTVKLNSFLRNNRVRAMRLVNFEFFSVGFLSKMFGDRYSISCGLKAMRYHSRYTSQPVYAYHLSYNGKYSIVQLLGQNSQDWGNLNY